MSKEMLAELVICTWQVFSIIEQFSTFIDFFSTVSSCLEIL